MMKKLISILLLFVIVQSVALCQIASPGRPTSAGLPHLPFNDSVAVSIAWLNRPWVGDDTPYDVLRSEVEQSQKAGKLDDYVKEARSEYAKNPSDYKIQFKYFYSIWLNKYENEVYYPYDNVADAATSFLFLPRLESQYPRTYNFTRMVALSFDTWKEEQNAELLPFAERLMHADPGDIAIKLLIPDILASTNQAGLQEQAIQLANGLAAKYPDNAIAQHAQGYAYYRRWTATHDPVLAQKAIDAYERYLKLEIPGGYYKPVALDAIRILQKGIASEAQPKS